jgi:hypothetical protein
MLKSVFYFHYSYNYVLSVFTFVDVRSDNDDSDEDYVRDSANAESDDSYEIPVVLSTFTICSSVVECKIFQAVLCFIVTVYDNNPQILQDYMSQLHATTLGRTYMYCNLQ